MTLFGKRIFADVIKLRILLEIVLYPLGPKCNHMCFIRARQREIKNVEEKMM